MSKKHIQGETQGLRLFTNWYPLLWNTPKFKKIFYDSETLKFNDNFLELTSIGVFFKGL